MRFVELAAIVVFRNIIESTRRLISCLIACVLVVLPSQVGNRLWGAVVGSANFSQEIAMEVTSLLGCKATLQLGQLRSNAVPVCPRARSQITISHMS